jgi:hypothetical protein
LQNRLTNQPFIIDDLDDDVFLQTLLKEWIHSLKAYLQALEEKDIQVGYLQNDKNPSKEKASKSFWLAFSPLKRKLREICLWRQLSKKLIWIFTHKETP